MKREDVLSVTEMASALGNVHPSLVRDRALRRGVGFKVKGVWIFGHDDIKKMQPGKCGKPRKAK
jgi:hypothetical protein